MANNLFKDIATKADIVAVVSHFLGAQSLHKKGNVYYALCPFHDDHNPSFRVDPVRNTCKCFTCNHGGDAIAFVEDYLKCKPLDALKQVCEICSIPLPDELNRRVKEFPYVRESSCLEFLSKYYQMILKTDEGKDCLEYFKKRGIDEETIEHFSLGYAPLDTNGSIQALRKKGFTIDEMTRAGVLSSSAQLQDLYSQRMMIPIKDSSGHIVGFSGRAIFETKSGKYINYSETQLFKKAQIIYNFDNAKSEAKKRSYIYLVEGYMDAIALYRAGVKACGALMGVELTDYHVQMLKRLGVEVRLCLDADEPGQIAIERNIEKLYAQNIKTRVVIRFTQGKDSDEIFTKYGKDALLKNLRRLCSPFLFKFRRLMGVKERMILPDEMTKFLMSNAKFYRVLNPVEQEESLKVLQKYSNISIDTLKRILNNTASNQLKGEVPAVTGFKKHRKQSEKFLDVTYGGKYANIDYFNEFVNAIFEHDDSGFKKVLIENEAELLSFLLCKRSFYDGFNKSDSYFIVKAIDYIFTLISSIYEDDHLLISFKDLSFLKEKLISDDNEEDEFSPNLDLKLNSDEISFYSQVLDTLEKSPYLKANEQAFNDKLAVHKYYLEIVQIVKGNTSLNVENRMKIKELNDKIAKLNGKPYPLK